MFAPKNEYENELRLLMNLQPSFNSDNSKLQGLRVEVCRKVEYRFNEDATEVIQRVLNHSGDYSESSVKNLSGCTTPFDAFDQSWVRSPTWPKIGETKRDIRFADLFAGCGGMSLGLWEACRSAGMRALPTFASELDPAKAAVYQANFAPQKMSVGPTEDALNGEVGEPLTQEEWKLRYDIGNIDILIGGPPCQGHSDLNNHTRRKDPRNLLVARMTRFCEIFRPELIFIENVQGINRDKFGALSSARNSLRDFGYRVQDILLHCNLYGVPQTRKRHFLIASATHQSLDFLKLSPKATIERNVEWAIGDLLENQELSIFNTAANHSAENKRRITYLFNNGLYDLPNSERPDCHRYKEHAYNSVYGRMHWDRPSPTITTGFGSTGQGRFVHPMKPRTLTPHETARIQTIPDFIKFGESGRTQLQKMIGNSVPPLAMARLALELLL
jgi:DNA (cytosine-5)-methyltransferase 1